MTILHLIWQYVAANPWTVFLTFYALVNIVWAQSPKPTSPVAIRIWATIHFVLQLIVTHKDEPGTFTWPGVLRIFSESILKTAIPRAPTNDPPE